MMCLKIIISLAIQFYCLFFRLLQEYQKETHFAALKIQRLWRGYTVRKTIEGWNIAATKIQKILRGWLLRLHLPEKYQECWEYRIKKFYDVKATKIQAWWRGYLVSMSNYLCANLQG